MNHYFDAAVWNDDDDEHRCPHTNKNATQKGVKQVVNARVIHAVHATYRDSSISGTFVLGKNVKLPLTNNGWQPMIVYCRWFDHRLKTRGIRLNVEMATAKVDENYTGPATANIGL